MSNFYDSYLKNITETYIGGDTTELSFYSALKEFLEDYAKENNHQITVTTNPSKTDSAITSVTPKVDFELAKSD